MLRIVFLDELAWPQDCQRDARFSNTVSGHQDVVAVQSNQELRTRLSRRCQDMDVVRIFQMPFVPRHDLRRRYRQKVPANCGEILVEAAQCFLWKANLEGAQGFDEYGKRCLGSEAAVPTGVKEKGGTASRRVRAGNQH